MILWKITFIFILLENILYKKCFYLFQKGKHVFISSPETEKATTEINSYVHEDEDKESDVISAPDSYDTDIFDQFDQAYSTTTRK